MTFFPTHAHTIPAPMGGGWIVPDTERGECVLRSFFEGNYIHDSR